MARYDRIAPLTSPSRDHAFPAWAVLRDVEKQDRDVDVCRRARLRFLALRPVRRLLDRDAVAVSEQSYLRQIEAVREELGSLSARDVERARLTRFLRQIEDRDPARLVTALLEFAQQVLAAGHDYAAEEYALTAQGLAASTGSGQRQAAARVLERIARLRAGEDVAPDDAALEMGWDTLRQTNEPAERARVLELLGRALLDARMYPAAERCFAIMVQKPADSTARSRGRAAYGRVAALGGRADTFREERTALLGDMAEWGPDPRVAASVHNDLAHGCVAVGDADDAREHLRLAITIARRQGYDAMLKRAEGILTALEHNTEVLLQPGRSSSEAAQRIAAQIERSELPTPAH